MAHGMGHRRMTASRGADTHAATRFDTISDTCAPQGIPPSRAEWVSRCHPQARPYMRACARAAHGYTHVTLSHLSLYLGNRDMDHRDSQVSANVSEPVSTAEQPTPWRDAERMIAEGRAIDTVEIERRLREAVDVLRRLHVRGLRPTGHRSTWPDMLMDAFGDAPKGEQPRVAAPSLAEIRRMTEVIEVWLAAADRETRMIVWMRAARCKWRQIARAIERSDRHCQTRWNDALRRFAMTASKKK